MPTVAIFMLNFVDEQIHFTTNNGNWTILAMVFGFNWRMWINEMKTFDSIMRAIISFDLTKSTNIDGEAGNIDQSISMSFNRVQITSFIHVFIVDLFWTFLNISKQLRKKQKWSQTSRQFWIQQNKSKFVNDLFPLSKNQKIFMSTFWTRLIRIISHYSNFVTLLNGKWQHVHIAYIIEVNSKAKWYIRYQTCTVIVCDSVDGLGIGSADADSWKIFK